MITNGTTEEWQSQDVQRYKAKNDNKNIFTSHDVFTVLFFPIFIVPSILPVIPSRRSCFTQYNVTLQNFINLFVTSKFTLLQNTLFYT